MKILRMIAIFALFATPWSAQQLKAQSEGSTADIESKLYAKYKLTQTTADLSDIVTPGSVLVLHKNGFRMSGIAAGSPPTFAYKDGRLQLTGGSVFKSFGVTRDGSESSSVPKRIFVAGEKFWLTGIKVQQDSVVLTVYSDPFNDIRYYGELKFPFPGKKVVPPTGDVLKMIDEVVTVAGADNGAGPGPGPGPPPPPAEQLGAIPPPPPPADQPPPPPKTISVGQTKAIVIATWGQPSKDIKLPTKEILVYPDMKVTLVAGKVSDVQ